MGNPLESATFVRLLKKDMKEVSEDRFAELPTMVDRFFKMEGSDSAWEDYYSVGGLGDIPKFNGSLTYLGIDPGWHTKIEPSTYAVGVKRERKFVEDNKYSVLLDMGAKLMESAQRTREKTGARTFTGSTSSAFEFMTSEEGVALSSSSHTSKSNVSTASGFDNTGTSPISPAAIAATRVAMKQFRSDKGERISTGTNLGIIVPDNLFDRASEIVGTPISLDTAEGNKNMHHNRYEVIPYSLLDDTDTNNWHMVDLDAMKKYNLFIDRVKPEINTEVDFKTFSLDTSIYARQGTGHIDWRWIFSHVVS